MAAALLLLDELLGAVPVLVAAAAVPDVVTEFEAEPEDEVGVALGLG